MPFEYIKPKKECQKEMKSQWTMWPYLEEIVGHYFLSGAGISDVETLYYDPAAGPDDQINTIKENIAAFFLNNESIAFVRRDMLSKLMTDTEGYNVSLIPVENFSEECLSLEDLEQVSEFSDYLKGINMIDDDFMYDENKEFDFAAFEIIDSGAKFINPKHFSVEQLISVLREKEN